MCVTVTCPGKGGAAPGAGQDGLGHHQAQGLWDPTLPLSGCGAGTGHSPSLCFTQLRWARGSFWHPPRMDGFGKGLWHSPARVGGTSLCPLSLVTGTPGGGSSLGSHPQEPGGRCQWGAAHSSPPPLPTLSRGPGAVPMWGALHREPLMPHGPPSQPQQGGQCCQGKGQRAPRVQTREVQALPSGLQRPTCKGHRGTF